MPKTGIITAPTGADENLKTLGASQPVRDTLMGVVRSALSLAVATKLVIINFFVRKAVLVPSGTGIATVVEATGYTELGKFVKDDPSKASSPWTFLGTALDDDAFDGIVAPVKPSMSVESLVNKIEDTFADSSSTMGGYSNRLVLSFDQSNGEIYLTTFDTDGHAAASHTAAVALAEDVQYVQTLDSGSTQFGE